ncbi:CCA tRNA nucleotidyltransferase [Salimicrobium halophilum]|uniref:tRNA nucleotidyltransferase (CCA-adding enzyme) n=1 Tax=Salimicrobium halophilum TaxID=86666 RepID=A0A1G8Q1J8_9BACI|nr:CCA tRNA nucleotidyltransferase [Salimicrobium halophilum]SDI98609.1 tRNA nucleotidyltransferase (CCA-adding enzyme) [Salimicrobium halophilum]
MNYEHMPLFQLAREVMERIEAYGGEAYIVGGCVRDLILQHEVGDIDIATSLVPEEVMEVFDKVIPVGVEHGTVIVRHRSHSFEVTTYRIEEDYRNYRHPERVYFVSSIEKDLSRRDFTMNAIAMSGSGDIIDPFNGREAIREKRITTVGKAEDRFEEDPLRMMRALRFSAQLNFSIDEEVYSVINEKKGLLEHLSVERIAEEFIKLMTSYSYLEGWRNLKLTGVYHYFPIFRNRPFLIDARPATRLTDWGELISFYHLQARDTDVKEWITSWKLSNRIRKKAEKLIEAFHLFEENETINYAMYQLGEDYLHSFRNLTSSLGIDLSFDPRDTYDNLPVHARNDLALKTSELMDVFPERKKGKWIGEYLHAMEESVVQGTCRNQKHELIEWVKEWDQQNRN